MVLFNGCSGEQAKTGFLSDYAKLQKESDSSMRYINEKTLPQYSAFMIDPVKAVFKPAC